MPRAGVYRYGLSTLSQTATAGRAQMLLPFRGWREVEAEFIKLSAVIAEIYDAAIEPALWQQALASICAYVGGHSGMIYWHDAARQSAQAIHAFNTDPRYTQLYYDKYLPMNPVFPAATFMAEGVVHSST